MSRLLEEDTIVKKEVSMKRRTAWLFALILILSLTACKKRGTVTPGNLVTPTPYTPHISAETVDVSGEYAERLCSYPWMETYDMSFYCFSADGSYQHFGDKDLTETLDSGKWQMKKDANGYLALHIEVDGGEPFDLYDLELYEQSIFAHSLTETAYMWLLCDTVEEE
jgi:hypothetical protein